MKIEDIQVELKPHRGVTSTQAGDIEVELPQKVIFVNGIWAGYVGDAPGSHISIILRDLPEPVLAEIKRKVDEQRGSVSKTITQAKQLDESNVTAEEVVKQNSLSDLGL